VSLNFNIYSISIFVGVLSFYYISLLQISLTYHFGIFWIPYDGKKCRKILMSQNFIVAKFKGCNILLSQNLSVGKFLCPKILIFNGANN
jgi:hypothetical protein